MRLSELRTGEKGVIVKVHGYGGFRKRIIEMGFIQGKIVTVLLNAPLKDPIKYSVIGYEVSLRRSEAANIEVISVEEARKIASTQKKEKFTGVITDEEFEQIALQKRKEITVSLVGNPNCGKTSFFNLAANQHERVGNYSGVTVGAKKGIMHYKGYKITLVDLPGTYSLSAYSPEERFVRNNIANEKPDVVINVVDSTNLERNLFLTTQLIDMNVRMVVALNMYDELQKRGDELDVMLLSKLMGIPFIPTISTQNKGITDVFDSVIDLYEGKLANIVRHIHINYGTTLETAIDRVKAKINENENIKETFTPRYMAIKFLEKDKDMTDYLYQCTNYEEIINVRDKEAAYVKKDMYDYPENVFIDEKYGFISGALKETLKPARKKAGTSFTDRIDNIVTDKYKGYPIFLIVIFLMFEATFYLGQFPMAWIQSGVDLLSGWLSSIMSAGILKDMLVDGIVAGVGGVIIFLPNILILYFCIMLLESTGYMARAAFIMDKLMHKIGLHGRSFIPLVMGFGCNVPAIMATRTIENRNNRMITILITPLISCSARLPIYILLIGTFFPMHAGLVLFCVYFTGIVLAVIMARIFKKFLFTKDETPFVMELPPYRAPGIKSLLLGTWDKAEQYLKKIGTTILVGSLIIWALGYFPVHNIYGEKRSSTVKPAQTELSSAVNDNSEQEFNQDSYLTSIGKFIQPVMKPLGFDWKMSVALLSGIAAKEIVVSTMGIIYMPPGNAGNLSLQEALRTELRPDGSHMFNTAVCLSLLLFVLIYIPCIATIVTIKHETGKWRWALFAVAYTVLLAWIVSFLVYNCVRLGIYQQVIVGFLILMALYLSIKKIRKTFGKKNKCDSICEECRFSGECKLKELKKK